jgi:hypothetical protein
MKKSFALFILVGLLCSMKTVAQSLLNDIAFLSVSREIAANISEKKFDTKSSELSFAYLETFFKNKQRTRAVLGYTKQNRPVDVYYFPGTSDKRALIIGGMHGSELSSVEVAMNIVRLLSNGDCTYYDVLIIPSLFPDNVASAHSKLNTKKLTNFGRYTSEASADPNRQMPSLGKEFDKEKPFDFNGRLIEKENQYLLQLIQDYKPSRIVNLHAIKDITKAGIYADPRTDCNGLALGFETDSSLAVSMANYICEKGGRVPGNNLAMNPTALYYHDPQIAAVGSLQKRNLHGSPLPKDRGFGVSLGGWATSAICKEDSLVRDAIPLITVEFPGYKPSFAYATEVEKEQCQFNIQLYSAAVTSIFLSEVSEEQKNELVQK